MCIANHMRTGEIIDLANERRLSAVLDFTHLGGELLVLNGGSRAEEFVVISGVQGNRHQERRAAYCIDSGTSMQVSIPLLAAESAQTVTVRIIGGNGEMVLQPERLRRRALAIPRVASTLAAALVLLLLAGGRLDSPLVFASADPEPAAADTPIVRPNVSLAIPAHLPSVVTRDRPLRHLVIAASRSVDRHSALASALSAAVITAPSGYGGKKVAVAETPEPHMTDLRVPSTAKSGDFIPVSFGAVARQVKIVASIGPTIVSKTIIGAQHGVIAIRSPKSDLDSRIMTVRAYAQNGNRTASLQAMVVLVRP